MRNRITIGTAALLLASASLAWAQAKQQPQEQQQEQQAVSAYTTGGSIDIAARITGVTGDNARYERYRDLRTGANLNFLYSKVTDNWAFNVIAENVGYRDQRYRAGFESKRWKLMFSYDQIPLNYSYQTKTPYNCTAGACTLDAAARAQVQAKTAIGIPQNVAQLGNPSLSIYRGLSNPFNLQSRRDTVTGSVIFSATDNLDFTFDFTNFKRSGNMPWGASFAFNVATEEPLVIDNNTTDIQAGIEWASHQGMMRAYYDYSKFTQNIPTFTFDNPQFATDYNLNKTTVTGYDPSGYSNGNGPARGRLAMPPTNTLASFGFLGMVKLPNRTTANVSFQTGVNDQNAALIPFTINPVIANPLVYAQFPGLAALPRDTAQMSVNYTNASVNVNSRPSKYVSLSARYRYYGRNDFTLPFDADEYVRFDAVPEEGQGAIQPLNISDNKFDADAAFTPFKFGTIRVGYGYDALRHRTRATEGWKDSTARVSFDTVTTNWLTLRALYERTKRDTINFSQAILDEMATQPDARFFDEAARIRNRATFIAEVNPVSMVGINVSASTGKDDYQANDAAQEFGLLNNTNNAVTIGVNIAPNAKVNFGAEYGRETYNALQQSRNANPAPDPSWTDPNRNWALTEDETVNNFSIYANLVRVLAKTDIRFGYDYSNSDDAYVHSGPRINAFISNLDPTTGRTACSAGVTSCFVALPAVTEKWQRATFDVKYDISKKFGVAFSYWYEKFDVADFATMNSAGSDTLPLSTLGTQDNTPRNDWLGELFTGYGNRPYRGQTAFVRVIYMF